MVNRLFAKFQSNVKNHPRHILLEDDENSYTFQDLDFISGKIYRYLKDKNIDKEDIVMLLLPRCALTLCVFCGVLRAGACAVIVTSKASKANRNFFIEDANPKIIIDLKLIAEIMKLSPLEGYEKVNEHDAAVIIYTSSSTAKAKGAIHEYGDINLLIEYIAYLKCEDIIAKERGAVVAQLYDVATITSFIETLYAEGYLYIVKEADGKDSKRYAEIIQKNNLTTAYLMPHMTDLKLLSTLPSIESLYVSFDVIKDVYLPEIKIYNTYGMSESFIDAATFIIDKSYDITPVGKPNPFINTHLVDENDKEVPVGEIGEVVFDNPYFRAYLNRPKETSYAKRNGLFHTNDLGYLNEEGNMVIIGRKTNVFKVDDDYIIPALIETELHKYYPSKIIVQAYQKAEKIYVVAYYLEVETNKVNWKTIRNNCSKTLSSKQIPKFFIGLDSFPLLTSGKLNRIRLQDIFESYLIDLNKTQKASNQ